MPAIGVGPVLAGKPPAWAVVRLLLGPPFHWLVVSASVPAMNTPRLSNVYAGVPFGAYAVAVVFTRSWAVCDDAPRSDVSENSVQLFSYFERLCCTVMSTFSSGLLYWPA